MTQIFKHTEGINILIQCRQYHSFMEVCKGIATVHDERLQEEGRLMSNISRGGAVAGTKRKIIVAREGESGKDLGVEEAEEEKELGRGGGGREDTAISE